MEEPEKKKIGGGAFIASGVFTILTPAIFFIVLGDFFSLIKDCSLPYATVDIGEGLIVNCSEIRLIYIISFIAVFIGIILVIWGLAKKVIDYKKNSYTENQRRTRENKIYRPLIKEVKPKVVEKKVKFQEGTVKTAPAAVRKKEIEEKTKQKIKVEKHIKKKPVRNREIKKRTEEVESDTESEDFEGFKALIKSEKLKERPKKGKSKIKRR